MESAAHLVLVSVALTYWVGAAPNYLWPVHFPATVLDFGLQFSVPGPGLVAVELQQKCVGYLD